MNFNKKLSLAAGFAAMAFAAAPAFAQARVSMRANIPFSFAAGNQVLPSGEYVVVFDQFKHVVFEPVNDTHVRVVRIGIGQPSRNRGDVSRGLLRFYKYGDTLVLGGVWRPGAVDGSEVKVSGRALEARRLGDVREVTLN